MAEFRDDCGTCKGSRHYARIAAAATAAKLFNHILAAQQATWEPHDWEDFKCPPSA